MDSAPTDETAAGVEGSAALELRGADVLPLLHRISTQALLDLAPGDARATLFCDFRGRLLHRAVVAIARDGAVWLLRDDAPGAPLAAFVGRHVFREDVKIADRSGEQWVEAVESPPDTAPGVVERDGGPGRVTAGDGATLIVHPGPAPEHTPEAWAERGRRRIRMGRAGHGHEIAEEFNPFEVGLGGDVHLDKGCFTGQEALQRLVTYDSVRRRLARVAGRGLAPVAPADVTCDGERAGVLTSAAEDATIEEPGLWIGLAVLKREIAESGRALVVYGQRLDALNLLPMPRALGRP